MSKKIFLFLLTISFTSIFAQKPCEIDTNISDSLGTYKSTKQYMIFERNFAGNSTNIFFTLTNTNGILGVDVQILQRSADFIKATCLDASSKIFLQLQNGKIVTLVHVGSDSCGTFLRDDKKGNNRLLNGTFLFVKDNFEELKASRITFMRIKYSGETVDYPFRTEFVSDLDKTMYQPDSYFLNYLKCIEAN